MKHNHMLLQVEHLKKYFPIQKGVFRKTIGHVKAVDDVSFSIKPGETVGLVGESGCGKTTTGRCIIRLLEPTFGSIEFHTTNGMQDLSTLKKADMKTIRQQIQIIFQDPFSSLNPRMSIRDIIAEPLWTHKIGRTHKEQTDRVRELLERVGLNTYQMNRYPHEFSGGQRQRIGIARALALDPRLIICDEPVSALDVSVQAQILNLLIDLQADLGLTYLFIAHDLSVVEHISDRVIVMYLGKIVEVARAESIYANPQHPYTEALLAAIPIADPRSTKKRVVLKGRVPDPSNPPSGCAFHTRCSYVQDMCRAETPELLDVGGEEDHRVACHYHQELSLHGYQTEDKG